MARKKRRGYREEKTYIQDITHVKGRPRANILEKLEGKTIGDG